VKKLVEHIAQWGVILFISYNKIN